MDDESFADALESSWAGSRRTSGNLGTVLDDPFGLKTLNIPKSSPTVGTAPFGNSYPPSTILPGQNPFELGFADGIVNLVYHLMINCIMLTIGTKWPYLSHYS